MAAAAHLNGFGRTTDAATTLDVDAPDRALGFGEAAVGLRVVDVRVFARAWGELLNTRVTMACRRRA